MKLQLSNPMTVLLWTLCILIWPITAGSAQDPDYVEIGRQALEQQGKLPWYDQKRDQFKSTGPARRRFTHRQRNAVR